VIVVVQLAHDGIPAAQITLIDIDVSVERGAGDSVE